MSFTSSSRVFQALSDGTRRDIVELLRTGPRTSGDIASAFQSSWPTISRHLAVLRDANLLSTERRGQEIYYELNTSVFQDLAQVVMTWAAPVGGARRRVRAGRRAPRVV